MDSLKKEFERIKKSIQEHGQMDPIIVREIKNNEYEIVNGYHRWNAMKDLGYDECEIKNLGKIELMDAISKTLSFEKTSIIMDPLMESELIKRYVESEADVLKLPYFDEEIRERLELLNFDWDKIEAQGKTSEGKQKETSIDVECPACHHKFVHIINE